MPSSISAVATSTGALPRPVTQWTPMQVSGSDRNSLDTKHSHLSTISWVGADPSVKLNSDTVTPAKHYSECCECAGELPTTFSELLCLVELVRGADQMGHLVVL